VYALLFRLQVYRVVVDEVDENPELVEGTCGTDENEKALVEDEDSNIACVAAAMNTLDDRDRLIERIETLIILFDRLTVIWMDSR